MSTWTRTHPGSRIPGYFDIRTPGSLDAGTTVFQSPMCVRQRHLRHPTGRSSSLQLPLLIWDCARALSLRLLPETMREGLARRDYSQHTSRNGHMLPLGDGPCIRSLAFSRMGSPRPGWWRIGMSGGMPYLAVSSTPNCSTPRCRDSLCLCNLVAGRSCSASSQATK